MSTSQALIELEEVSFHASGRTILDRATWSIRPDHHCAVLGPNGCGKTTLLRIATGFQWHTSGTVRRLGRELLDLGELRKSIGWISADLVAMIPPYEPARNTVVAGRFAQIGFKNLPSCQPTAADREEALRKLESVSALDLADRPFGVLSQGEKQKVLIARARMARPLLLVLDEPCAGLDPGARERLLSALDTLAQDAEAPTVILVTHHVEEIMPPFKQTLVMSAGRVAAWGPTSQVVTASTLAEVYGVSIDRIETCGGRLWPIWSTAHSA